MLQKVFVRAFAEASATDAAELAERLRQCLESIPAHVGVTKIKPYWKIDGYQEICLDVHIFGNGLQGFSATIEQLGTGWIHSRPGEAVWNHGESTTFIEPSVRWAHVEILE